MEFTLDGATIELNFGNRRIPVMLGPFRFDNNEFSTRFPNLIARFKHKSERILDSTRYNGWILEHILGDYSVYYCSHKNKKIEYVIVFLSDIVSKDERERLKSKDPVEFIEEITRFD
jgi:hypothetical protein